ncbi:MAG TPA: ISKra4 family transposase [Anaeromyxobacteraceae bacterium]|nr:ISKra4 family transposase [Anaeromyxobacteraceae bacterium]
MKQYSEKELLDEIAHRHADKHFREGMTMSEMELSVEELKRGTGEPSIALMLSRMKPEKPTGKACPKCGKRIPVKARDRERTVQSLAGPVTFKRNYHHCQECKYGFYPVDRLLGLPEEGELTGELEKRILDFAVNDVYGECAARWRLHYERRFSENLFRSTVARVGQQCTTADQGRLQEELKPRQKAAEVLVVEVDGSMLPIRGEEPWKEAKVGVTYRHDTAGNEPISGTSRYVAVVNGLGEFAPVLEDLLEVENIDDVGKVVWLGDGAVCNWSLADQLCPDAVQILDWHHAVEHAMDCGKVLLGEDSPLLPLWQRRAEELLATGDPEALISEVMDCLELIEPRKRDTRERLQALEDLVRYYRSNARRMKYRLYREDRLPIGSGAVESAHRHVLQTRMKRAGQHWAIKNARRMARLRAAYRTAGPLRFYAAIRRAHWDTLTSAHRQRGRQQHFRYARYGTRDLDRCASN